MKKLLSVAIVIALLLSFAPAALAAGSEPDSGSLHISYKDTDSVYGGDNYLYDTLTLAGAGFESISTYTVYDLEKLAADKTLGLGYENTYSLMTSGKVFSQSLMTGMKLYDLLVYSGIDETMPDSTPVKAISKDGYTIAFTLGELRNSDLYSRYASMESAEPEETGLPVMIAFGSNGLPLVGPTGSEPVYKVFDEADGYSAKADNVGGPVRLVIGQTEPTIFNAPNCSKWLAAVVVGDANGYEYDRKSDAENDDSEPESGGDWTHGEAFDSYTLTITGSEVAEETTLTISQLEAMTDISSRGYYACSAGRDAYEGIILRQLILKYLDKSLTAPTKVTVISSDGYSKVVDIGDLMNGIDSYYQPGKHKDMLLAYAINGSPLVESTESDGYNGSNAYGPLRLAVENTVSAWVKCVVKIVVGEDTSAPFDDLNGHKWAEKAIGYLYSRGIVNGTGGSSYSPASNIKRGDFMLMLARAYNLSEIAEADGSFDDVPENSYYYDAIASAAALGIARGDGSSFRPEDAITRQDAMTLLCRTLDKVGKAPADGKPLTGFSDISMISEYALGSVTALVGAGIINGSDGAINPLGFMTRAELAQALYKALTR